MQKIVIKVFEANERSNQKALRNYNDNIYVQKFFWSTTFLNFIDTLTEWDFFLFFNYL